MNTHDLSRLFILTLFLLLSSMAFSNDAAAASTCTVNGVQVDCATGTPINPPGSGAGRDQLCPERQYELIYGRYCDHKITTIRYQAFMLQHAYSGAGFNQGVSFSTAFRLNDNSDVVGSAVTSAGDIHAVRMNVGDSYFNNLYFTDLGQPGLSSEARAVSNEMTYAGQLQTNAGDTHSHEATWYNQNPQTINALGNERGVATGIARNQFYDEYVTGYSVWNDNPWTSDGLEHGFIRTFDGYSASIIRIGFYGQANRANAINDSKIAVGYLSSYSGNKNASSFSLGNITSLPNGGSSESQALDVNNNVAHIIVGYSSNWSGSKQAVKWVSGTMTTLVALPSAVNSAGNAVTDGGDIVGQSGNRAVFWRDGNVYDLNLKTDNSVNTTFTEALDINRRGRILVKGSDLNYYILIPSEDIL